MRFLPEKSVLDRALERAGALAPERAGGERPSLRIRIPARPRTLPPVPAAPPEKALTTLPPLAAAAADESLSLADLDAPIEARVERLVGWLMGSTGAFAAFVADADGLALANRHVPESYVAVTTALADAQRAVAQLVPSPPAGSTTLELHDDNVLQVVWADTAVGRICAGLVLAEPLERSIVHAIRRMLANAVRTKGVH